MGTVSFWPQQNMQISLEKAAMEIIDYLKSIRP